MRRAACALALAALSAACSVPPSITDTGYVGTWARGNDRVRSVVSIARGEGDRWYFRWTKMSDRGTLAIRCPWEGVCEERLNDETIATHAFRIWQDPDSGHLMVEGTEKRLKPDKVDIHFVDELVVVDGGKTLWSYTLERDGQRFEGAGRPQRSLTKVSDSVGVRPHGAVAP